MVHDRSFDDMESKRIRLDSNQIPLRPIQIPNNPQQPSRSLQLPVYPPGAMVNGNNNNMQQRTYFLSNVRIRHPVVDAMRDQRGLPLIPTPSHNQPSGIANNNTMTGAILPQPTHLTNARPSAMQQSSQVSLPSYNLQPPPPVFSNNVMKFPVYPGSAQPSTTIPCIEVRIGSKKFKTTSGVSFKEDGILFTLKDYTYAPVLLNARAIQKCKANLNVIGYPAIFLLLENSCMKQIRQIFGLLEEDFSHHSSVELLRYITIFPTYGPEHKTQSQHIMQSIKKSFDLMLKRFPRANPVLEEITNEQCIDILYSPFGNSTDLSTGAATVRQNSVEEVASQPSAVAPISSQPTMVVSTNFPTTPIRSEPINTQPLQRPLPSTNYQDNFLSSAIPLVLPSDQESWLLLQKDLTVGGVYHVVMQDGRKNYCLWNGSQLVSCLVQNTEVQMTCSHARLGMSLLKCMGQVRVKADQANGLFFTVRKTNIDDSDLKKDLAEILIQPMDIMKMQIFFHGAFSSIIISVTPECSNRLSEKCSLSEHSSLVRRPFDSASGDPSRSYMILFIQHLHKDQEEALLQMKYTSSTPHIKKNSPMFESIDLQTALSTLCQIVAGSSDAGKRFESTNNISGLTGYEKIVRICLNKDPQVLSNAPLAKPPPPSSVPIIDEDDDDDDIIMTQQELGIKCPYTQQVMKDPVMNKKCKHNYEKEAIFEFIALKKGSARCPYAGCANQDPLSAVDLETNQSLKEYILQKQKS